MTHQEYVKQLEKALQLGNATEHTHRPALKALLESIDQKITATNEPKRVRCGAPDYILTRGQTPIGYIEAKDIGVSLTEVEKSPQLKRYRESLGNLVLTDYLEFRWYVAGEHRLTGRLATPDVKGRLRNDKEGMEQTLKLLQQFLALETTVIGSPRELAARMAALARLIRDTLRAAFNEEDLTDDKPDPLHDQLEGFRKVLLHDLTPEQFADMYAQTICYGMFAARCNASPGARFDRQHAAFNLPKTNPFLRKLFLHIAGPDLDERITWAVDDLAELLNRADMAAILADFGKHTRREDPVVHFYETFLAHYDPKMREARGVYYTPEPVVSYIVRSVDHVLKTDFNLPAGLAEASKVKLSRPKQRGKGNETFETHRVQILDPATGTGTFLYSVIDHIHESFKGNKGMWSGYVSEHLLPRVHGFELLMAPYAVAHMKLGLQLTETGYDFKADERLHIYLTNTLEEVHELYNLPLFTQWLADEANSAAQVKQDAPIMVVLGNPPYSNFGMMNRGKWIRELLQDYKHGLNEKKLNIDDDFIKFIRFGQWRIEQTGYGILAFVTNHTYLDGLTHRRMRESLMETFDDVYLLDLHGNSKRKEKAPDGGKDENVFDIQQGVAIGIFVKRPKRKKDCTVRHAELWGTRESKYAWLYEQDVTSTARRKLAPEAPWFFFVPKSFDLATEYEGFEHLKDIFEVFGNGIGTDRDDLFYGFDREEVGTRIRAFYSPEGIKKPFVEQYRVQNSSSYPLLSRRLATRFSESKIQRCLYRPFDIRWLYYDPKLTSRPAYEVMQHLSENLTLLLTRQVSTTEFRHVFVANTIIDRDPLSLVTRERSQAFPLYLDRGHGTLDFGHGRCLNLKGSFIEKLGLTLRLTPGGKYGLPAGLTPEDIFHYAYAVFHSPGYRSRYAEFLKIDFPRLPLTSNLELFRALCRLGEELVGLHLMERHGSIITRYPVPGDNTVENVRYSEPGAEGETGRVYINKTQYFEGIPPEVRNFHIGGYQVCQKWLKDRKGRQLTYDDLTHYHCIVAALSETIRLMVKVDAAIEANGGWPVR